MKRNAWWIIGALIGVMVLGAMAVGVWRTAAERSALQRTLAAAERAVSGSRWTEARAVLAEQSRRRGRPAEPEAAARWAKIEFLVAGGLRDFATLQMLAVQNPDLVNLSEGDALWLWRLYRMSGDEEEAVAVRARWRGREQMLEAWICAEVDALWSSGRKEEARVLMDEAVLPPETAVPLLLRRALLGADPMRRLEAITRAYELDPTSADVRGVRAGILEKVGQPEYARVDYVAALVMDPNNPLRRDDLASFYLRQGDVTMAVETWREGLDEKSPDFMWVRAVFWGRVLGLGNPAAAARLPEWRRARFAGWLANLPEDRFWDEAGYADLHLPAAHVSREPAVFWLRLLEQLRVGDWAVVEQSLDSAPTLAVATAPGLHRAMQATARVRAGKAPREMGLGWPTSVAGGHRWWSVIAGALKGEKSAEAELVAVARGPQAASSFLLAAGWVGPAVELADWAEASKESTPGWLRYGLLQARRAVRGVDDALSWGAALPAYPDTDYVMAVMGLAAGRAGSEDGLRQLARRADDLGFAAGWWLATWLLEQGRLNEAEQVVMGGPALMGTPEGVAVRARVALAQGRVSEAKTLYEPFAERLLEAGAFLAREAFAGGDLVRARKLTEYWIAQYPDELQLRANLEVIEAAEVQAGGAR